MLPRRARCKIPFRAGGSPLSIFPIWATESTIFSCSGHESQLLSFRVSEICPTGRPDMLPPAHHSIEGHLLAGLNDTGVLTSQAFCAGDALAILLHRHKPIISRDYRPPRHRQRLSALRVANACHYQKPLRGEITIVRVPLRLDFPAKRDQLGDLVGHAVPYELLLTVLGPKSS